MWNSLRLSTLGLGLGCVLALAGCNSVETSEVVGATGALGEGPVEVVGAPVVVDTRRVDRIDEELRAVLDGTRDPEARFDARIEQFHAAEAELHRDETLDRRSAIETAAAIRARILGSEEARRDAESAERARILRGEPTTIDLRGMPSLAAARAIVERRIGTHAPVPVELRTPEGIATPVALPTAEELHHAPVR